jgi:peptide/nickel transport system ATP-binding protein
MKKDSAVLTVNDVKIHYSIDAGVVKAVENVSFSLEKGERLALVGESGSGKSTLAMSMMGLTSPPGKIVSGNILIGNKNLQELSDKEVRKTRLAEIALIPQGAMNSLNPVIRIDEQIVDGLQDHGVKDNKKGYNERVFALLERVGLARSVGRMYAHELSGGMKQRVAMAIATCLNPSVIIADEPTSALDVIVQRQVMITLGRLQKGLEASVMLVGHDMGLVAQFADRIGVMYAGKLVELGDVKKVFKSPYHPYTRMLIESLPDIDKKKDRLTGIDGLPPSLLNIKPGCAFCLRIGKETLEEPKWIEKDQGHFFSECKSCFDYKV